MKTKFTTLFVLLFVAVIATACGNQAPSEPPTSAFTQEQAIEIATNALANGYNNADVVAYSRDLDDSVKAMLTEEAFLQTQEAYMSKYGKFVSVEQAELTHAKTKGYVRWTFTGRFEKGTLYLSFVFPKDGTKAEGAGLYEEKP